MNTSPTYTGLPFEYSSFEIKARDTSIRKFIFEFIDNEMRENIALIDSEYDWFGKLAEYVKSKITDEDEVKDRIKSLKCNWFSHETVIQKYINTRLTAETLKNNFINEK